MLFELLATILYLDDVITIFDTQDYDWELEITPRDAINYYGDLDVFKVYGGNESETCVMLIGAKERFNKLKSQQ